MIELIRNLKYTRKDYFYKLKRQRDYMDIIANNLVDIINYKCHL
jgi:hypothetical protein